MAEADALADKHFSVAEANALLPRLTQLLEAMLAARQRILDERATWGPVIEKADGNGGGAHGKRLYHDTDKIQTILEEINDLGCIVKDVDSGLVDFPAIQQGREVFLCWKLGELNVAYWHDIDSGFAGRQPL